MVKALVEEHRVFNARVFVCPKCHRTTDDTLGRVKGPLRDCSRCDRPFFVLFVIQGDPIADKDRKKIKGSGQTPSSRITFR
jgi:hypothetical protein